MSLTGTYDRSLDSKLRLALPRKFREELAGTEGTRVYITPESNRSLGLFGEEVFHDRATRLGALSGGPGHVRNYMRLYYSQAEQADIDSQGRIRIPERLASFAGLQQEVMLLGVHDHGEIWDRSTWEQFLATHSADFDNLASEAFS